MKICTIEGCDRKQKARTWCTVHWGMWRRHGSPTATGATRGATDPDAFLAAKSTPSVGGCLRWSGRINRHGYGISYEKGRQVLAHRRVWEMKVRPIPPGMQIDHICGVRDCVNPEHLRIATSKQNNENRTVLSSINTSGYRGVSFHRPSGRWYAYVRHERKQIFAGSFLTPEEANEAAIALRNKLFTHNDADRAA